MVGTATAVPTITRPDHPPRLVVDGDGPVVDSLPSPTPVVPDLPDSGRGLPSNRTAPGGR